MSALRSADDMDIQPTPPTPISIHEDEDVRPLPNHLPPLPSASESAFSSSSASSSPFPSPIGGELAEGMESLSVFVARSVPLLSLPNKRIGNRCGVAGYFPFTHICHGITNIAALDELSLPRRYNIVHLAINPMMAKQLFDNRQACMYLKLEFSVPGEAAVQVFIANAFKFCFKAYEYARPGRTKTPKSQHQLMEIHNCNSLTHLFSGEVAFGSQLNDVAMLITCGGILAYRPQQKGTSKPDTLQKEYIHYVSQKRTAETLTFSLRIKDRVRLLRATLLDNKSDPICNVDIHAYGSGCPASSASASGAAAPSSSCSRLAQHLTTKRRRVLPNPPVVIAVPDQSLLLRRAFSATEVTDMPVEHHVHTLSFSDAEDDDYDFNDVDPDFKRSDGKGNEDEEEDNKSDGGEHDTNHGDDVEIGVQTDAKDFAPAAPPSLLPPGGNYPPSSPSHFFPASPPHVHINSMLNRPSPTHQMHAANANNAPTSGFFLSPKPYQRVASDSPSSSSS